MSDIITMLEDELRARQEREKAAQQAEADRVLYEQGTRYAVAAPYVTAKVATPATGGVTILGFYSGALLPDDTDPGSVQHLLDGGLVMPVDEPVAAVLAVPAGTPLPGRPPNVPVAVAAGSGQPVPPFDETLLERAAATAEQVGEPTDLDEEAVQPPAAGPQTQTVEDLSRPRDNESKEAWADHAVRQGADPADVDAMTKAQLIKEYGG